MTIQYEHQEYVQTSPEHAFAVIDDLPRTAEWLPPCVALKKLDEGPNHVGDKLRYVYRQGGREAEMECEILARIPGERLHCKYFDKGFEVSVDLRVAKKSDGTLTTHLIEITPKTFFGKLMSPMIRIGLGKQTRQAADNLKKLLESTSDA